MGPYLKQAGGGGPQTNLDPRFKLKSIGRMGSVDLFYLLISELFYLAAQLRTIRGPQANLGVLNNGGETSHN